MIYPVGTSNKLFFSWQVIYTFTAGGKHSVICGGPWKVILTEYTIGGFEHFQTLVVYFIKLYLEVHRFTFLILFFFILSTLLSATPRYEIHSNIEFVLVQI